MAIYHFSIKNIGRSKGRSAVACSAYRSGEKLTDRTYGKEQDYTKKTGVEFKKIYAPQNIKKELLNREELWNAVELSETKKNGDLKKTARLAKEFEVAFPCEISQQQREQMLEDLCNRLVEKHRVVVDAVIHAPHTKGGSDERNYHAHIMFTTRSINDKGELGQKTREFNDDGKNLTLEYRAYWAELANRELERANTQERVSHLSYKDLKYDLEPTIHEGSKVTQLRRKGIATEISVSNDLIKARNAERQLIKGLDQEITVTKQLVSNLTQDRSQLTFQKINEVTRRQRAELRAKEPNVVKRKAQYSIIAFKRLQQIEALKTTKKKTQQAQQIVRRYEAQLKHEFFKLCEGKTVTSEDFRDMTRRPKELKQAQDNLIQEYPKLANIYNKACQYLEKQQTQEAKKQAESKEKWEKLPAEEKEKIANYAILRYKRAVSDKSNEIAHRVVKQEKDEIRANLSHLEQDLKIIEHQKENLGKRPFWSGKKWDLAFGELSNQENNLKKRQKELLQTNPLPRPDHFKEEAKRIIDEEQPKFKKHHDNACKFLAKQKEIERQTSLEKIKITREQEKTQSEIKTRRVSRLR